MGKKHGQKKLDYKAKGRFGIIRTPISSLTIVMEERSLQDIIVDSLSGKFPEALAHATRKHLY